MIKRRLMSNHFIIWGSLLIAMIGVGSKEVIAETLENEPVEELFKALRDVQDRPPQLGVEFPELTWDDIPALLKLSESRRFLSHYISNPISSRHEPKVREGLYALWLIEGIRKGGDFPSQNPICITEGHKLEVEFDITDQAQKELSSAYKSWWRNHDTLSQKELAKQNPLKDTKYSWR